MNLGHDTAPVAGVPIVKGSFAVVLTWPTIRNAEYEVIQRIFTAGQNIGVDVHVTDNDGYPLWSNGPTTPSKRLDRNDCDFLISLHFESPRLYDIYSYIALWNPPEFLSAFGYSPSIEKMTSHNDVLSCASTFADTHARNSFRGMGRDFLEAPPLLFHSLPRPYLDSAISEDSRLFYVGINWEKISGQKGRHHDLLKTLDDENLIQIYGPKEFQGVEPWQDFRNYRGSIPFDGKSAIVEINNAGICLALSSRAHQRSGIMSTRLFEGLAAGAAIIANPHPFIEKYFSDCVYVIDDTVESGQLAEEIRSIIIGIREKPEEAIRRAKMGQRRLAENNFGLEANLTSLFQSHAERMAFSDRKRLGTESRSVSVVLMYYGHSFADFETLFANVARQVLVKVELFLVCDQLFYTENREEIEQLCRATSINLEVETDTLYRRIANQPPHRTLAAGGLVARALGRITADYFCVLQIDDHWMSDHLASLAFTLSQSAQLFACSGRLVEASGERAPLRRLDGLTFDRFGDLLECSHERDVGRFLYKAELLKRISLDTLLLLDGQEHQLLNLWAQMNGFPAQSGFATYVYLDTVEFMLPAPYVPYSLQADIIRDSARGNREWLQMRSCVPPRTGIKNRNIALNNMYTLAAGGDGVRFLSSGFSTPEPGFIWIDGKVGTLLIELRTEATDIHIQVLMAARFTPSSPRQNCQVFANDLLIGETSLTEQLQSFKFATPASLNRSTTLRISFKIETAEQVINDEGKLLDARYLGLRIASFGLMTSKPERKPSITPAKISPLRRIKRAIKRRLG